jgi:CheY-specific phosphatase CheX
MSNEEFEILTQVFCDVLEKQAFMFAEPSEKDQMPRDVENCVSTEIGFDGDSTGFIKCTVPSNLAIELASNIIGMDLGEDNPEEKANDAIKELLNITCGNFITEKFGNEAQISPTIPESQDMDSADWKSFIQDENSLAFIVDEIPLFISLNIQ